MSIRATMGPARCRSGRDMRRRRPAAWAAFLVLSLLPAVSPAQTRNNLPFEIGERLTYRVTIGGVGSGGGTMSVEGPVDVRGTSTYLLRSEVRARVGFAKVSDKSESWLDPVNMSALRYHRRERRALSHDDEDVEMFPAEQRWEARGGPGGESLTNRPLDELSFIYFVRTLPLTSESVLRLDRHYDRARNPIEIRVVGRDTVATAAGVFPAIIVEMRVKDPRRFRGNGLIRLTLSDDTLRLPLRIESAILLLGRAVLTLESFTSPRYRLAALTF